MEIMVSITSEEDKRIIEVSDNGQGFEEKDTNTEEHSGLGMQLIEVLAHDQLEGSLEINTTDGYSCKVLIPE